MPTTTAPVTTDTDPSLDPAVKLTPKWKQFERDILVLVTALDSKAVLEHNAHVPGVMSLVDRQIDLLAVGKLAGAPMRVIIECKAYKRPLDVGKVDEFIGKLMDVRSNHGVLYAMNGVTPAAANRAANSPSPTVEIRDMTAVPPVSAGPSGVFLETLLPPTEEELAADWVEDVVEALGYEPCPALNCFGEVYMGHSLPDEIPWGSCDYCGSLAMECLDCGLVENVEVGSNTCPGCDSSYYVNHDKKGEPTSIEREIDPEHPQEA